MPELPEVETTCRGIKKYLLGEEIAKLIIRRYDLRWPIPKQLPKQLKNQTIKSIKRRGKYILFEVDNGWMILHLGMSGHCHILPANTANKQHDHVDLILKNKLMLRFTDPRRFGSIHWVNGNPLSHKLLKDLGPEPLSKKFNSGYLFNKAKNKTQPVKTFIMDSKIVVGIGNIYANESLFLAGITPTQAAGNISKEKIQELVAAIKIVLKNAIKAGGTTLKDFKKSDGKPGFFRQHLQVYNRDGLPCVKCQTPLTTIKLGQRATTFCRYCQAL